MNSSEIRKARELSKAVAALGYKPQKKITPKTPKTFNFPYESLKARPGKDGQDGRTPGREELIELIKEHLPEIKQPTFEVTPELVKEIVKMMHSLPEADKLEVSKGIRNAQSFIYAGTKYQTSELMHGGASSAPGSTVTFETPTGTVDDSNVTFTVSHTPLYIVVNGSQYTVGNGLFATYAAGTITLSSPVGTTGFIQSAYNA